MQVFDEVDLLVEVYEKYITEQGLPSVSADEQDFNELTTEQVRWIESFETMGSCHMKFLVTNIAYDFNDGNADLSDDYKVTLEEMQQIIEDTIGVWEADDEDDLIEEISSASGWCIQNIDYEVQLK